MEEVRRVCGKDFIIDVRISGDEYSNGGQNINDATYVAKQLKKAGVDMIHVSGGVVRSKLAIRMMEKGIRIEAGAKVQSVTEDTITFEKDGVEYVIKDADTLVFANGYHVDSTVEDMLKAAGASYQLLGDGAKVGNIKDAISGAYEIARQL